MPDTKGRVLMLCYHYPPIRNAGVTRCVKFSRYLPLFGFTPVVLTTNAFGTGHEGPGKVIRTGEFFRAYTWVFNKLLRPAPQAPSAGPPAPPPEKGRLHRLLDCINRRIMIPDEKITWVRFAFLPALRLLRRGEADVIFSTSTPVSSHLLGLLLKLFTRRPWVMDLQDPWTIEPLNVHIMKPGFRLWLESRLERMCMRSADAVVLNTPEALEAYRRLYPEMAGKMRVISNGFDRSEIDAAEKGAFKQEGRFLISHVGSFCRHVDIEEAPEVLLKALKALIDEGIITSGNCRVVFAGGLNWATIEMIRRLGLEHVVETPGMLSHSEALGLIKDSDLLLLFDPNKEGRTYVHSKLYEYLASGRPILGILPEGAARGLLESSGHGEVVYPHDGEGIKKAIASASSRRGEIQDTGFDLSVYEWEELTARLSECLEDVLSKGAMEAGG